MLPEIPFTYVNPVLCMALIVDSLSIHGMPRGYVCEKISMKWYVQDIYIISVGSLAELKDHM